VAAGVSEDDELEVLTRESDNSIGRLLALSDGVFAIAMTLLVLDLKVPNLGDNPGNAALQHALVHDGTAYLSYVISFYVVASYWVEHHRLMRTVTSAPPALIFATLRMLFFVAAIPFPASLIGAYGGTPIALAVYGAFNAIVVLVMMRLRYTIRELHLSRVEPDSPADLRERWGDFAVFLLCIPAGYVLGDEGPLVLLLLAVSGLLAKRWPVSGGPRSRT
jgi:uncharacterized membrane protein